jgi:nucleotide-binding universal stress UspA family protein
LTYVDEIADAIRRAVPRALLPDGDTGALFRIYAVLAMAKGVGVELGDVHDAWSAWMSAQNPDHPSLKPLAELEADVRDADRPYLEAIRSVAREWRLGG